MAWRLKTRSSALDSAVILPTSPLAALPVARATSKETSASAEPATILTS